MPATSDGNSNSLADSQYSEKAEPRKKKAFKCAWG
jgi:hypothetical protein